MRAFFNKNPPLANPRSATDTHEGNKSYATRGVCGITILKPTIVTRALPSDSLTSLIIAMVTMSAPWLPFDVIAVYVNLASLASARKECSE